MKKQVFNPYMPLDIYIPDGEPHVFSDRIYVFGSHDREGGTEFCELDYEAFSAPVNDLTDWRREGIIYRSSQDPHVTKNRKDMYAPDVVQGNDGKYYLYYCLEGFAGPISVAVCDSPAGKYEYYGEVRYPDGRPMLRSIPFDPGIINDDGRIWLYYGWGLGMDLREQTEDLSDAEQLCQLFCKTPEEMKIEKEHTILGANVVELEDDMLTVKGEPNRILEAAMRAERGTVYYEHTFFEASSIRKFGDLYYFIYSSNTNYELCYATSKYPDRDFVYRGVIIADGDIGFEGRKPEERLTATGNNHGSIECINGQYYIFYHRLTHNTCFSRQACAERIEIEDDGTIRQVERTSCGLNGGPLQTEGIYPAPIACVLTNGHMPHLSSVEENPLAPNINHAGDERFITEISNGTIVGYKYFKFSGREKLTVTTRGEGQGEILVSTEMGGKVLGRIKVTPSQNWQISDITELACNEGVYALYFKYVGSKTISLLNFTFQEVVVV